MQKFRLLVLTCLIFSSVQDVDAQSIPRFDPMGSPVTRFNPGTTAGRLNAKFDPFRITPTSSVSAGAVGKTMAFRLELSGLLGSGRLESIDQGRIESDSKSTLRLREHAGVTIAEPTADGFGEGSIRNGVPIGFDWIVSVPNAGDVVFFHPVHGSFRFQGDPHVIDAQGRTVGDWLANRLLVVLPGTHQNRLVVYLESDGVAEGNAFGYIKSIVAFHDQESVRIDGVNPGAHLDGYKSFDPVAVHAAYSAQIQSAPRFYFVPGHDLRLANGHFPRLEKGTYDVPDEPISPPEQNEHVLRLVHGGFVPPATANGDPELARATMRLQQLMNGKHSRDANVVAAAEQALAAFDHALDGKLAWLSERKKIAARVERLNQRIQEVINGIDELDLQEDEEVHRLHRVLDDLKTEKVAVQVELERHDIQKPAGF